MWIEMFCFVLGLLPPKWSNPSVCQIFGKSNRSVSPFFFSREGEEAIALSRYSFKLMIGRCSYRTVPHGLQDLPPFLSSLQRQTVPCPALSCRRHSNRYPGTVSILKPHNLGHKYNTDTNTNATHTRRKEGKMKSKEA
ncbi:hypothetical protein L873DRAFT_1034642 [Choiromyces venosus 120613-1]|uniref:Secreted protein n=1 Tax=Choiromyces venosus 120613-1 TaxID=1336337 RepID=A0A3N4JJV9_9PEZI|nr:hypothetical protein L873DRAFT_1034642 [Choiromyces venosus 120613-1]